MLPGDLRVPAAGPGRPEVTRPTREAHETDPASPAGGYRPDPTAGPLPVLELAAVTKEYAGSPPVKAIDSIDLTVWSGELAAIVGPSGSGKSTLLHVIGTLDRPTSGRVVIGGRDVSDMSDKNLSAVRASLIGFVFQQFFLLHGMSAVDNVATGLVYLGLAPAARRRAAVEALERVGLGHRLDHEPNQLSGGERQRVAIARAVVHRPAIVLADEPTGNLDSRSSASIMDLLRELNDDGTTILVITHDRELGGSIPRQVSIRDGRIESDLGGEHSAGDGMRSHAAGEDLWRS